MFSSSLLLRINFIQLKARLTYVRSRVPRFDAARMPLSLKPLVGGSERHQSYGPFFTSVHVTQNIIFGCLLPRFTIPLISLTIKVRGRNFENLKFKVGSHVTYNMFVWAPCASLHYLSNRLGDER